MNPTTQKIINRFFKYVDKQNYHWIWTGAKSGNQGRIKINGVPIRVLKLSWVYHFGPIPEWSMLYRKCGNSLCVKPEHLARRYDSYEDKDKNKLPVDTPEWYQLNRELRDRYENLKPKPHDFELYDLLWTTSQKLPKNYYEKKSYLSPKRD